MYIYVCMCVCVYESLATRTVKQPEWQEQPMAIMRTVAANQPDSGHNHHPTGWLSPRLALNTPIESGLAKKHLPHFPGKPSKMGPHWGSPARLHLCINSCTGPLVRKRMSVSYPRRWKCRECSGA